MRARTAASATAAERKQSATERAANQTISNMYIAFQKYKTLALQVNIVSVRYEVKNIN